MSGYLGDFRVAKIVRKMWNSNAVAGESITLATNGTISAYKDGGTTQSTTGITATEDFDGLTGVHLVAIDTAADGTFYSAGAEFEVVLSGATIDGKAINATLFSFSLENRSALMPTTDGRKLDVSAGGEAGVDWANVGSPTTVVGLSGTTVKTATDVETDTADIQSRLPAALVGGTRIDASVGVMAANVMTAAAAAADLTTELQSGLATAAALATAQTSIDDIPTSAELAVALGTADDAVLAQVALVKAKTDNLPNDPADQSLVIAATDALATLIDSLPTHAELATALAGADDAVLAQVSLVKAVTDKIDDTLEDDGGTYRFTTNALEQAPTGGSAPTASDIADEVQTRTIAAVTVVNGLANNSVTAASFAADAGTEIGTAVWATGTRVLTAGTNIALAKGTGVTGFTDLDAAGVRGAVGLAGASLDTQFDALPTNAELVTALSGADDATLATIAALNNLSAAQVNAEVDAALAGVGLTTTITGRIDAAISSRLAGASYTAPDNAGIVAVKAKTDNLPSDPAGQSLVIAAISAGSAPTAIENADALLDRIDGIEAGWTPRYTIRILLSLAAGKTSGMNTTSNVFRDVGDTKNRVTATIDNGSNRTVVVTDPT